MKYKSVQYLLEDEPKKDKSMYIFTRNWKLGKKRRTNLDIIYKLYWLLHFLSAYVWNYIEFINFAFWILMIIFSREKNTFLR